MSILKPIHFVLLTLLLAAAPIVQGDEIKNKLVISAEDRLLWNWSRFAVWGFGRRRSLATHDRGRMRFFL